eukprot:COSAG05_NODE_22247_length_266_cov_0.616766_1_plen_47_part_01
MFLHNEEGKICWKTNNLMLGFQIHLRSIVQPTAVLPKPDRGKPAEAF